MCKLTAALAAWGTASFGATLKSEIERFGAKLLPLEQCARQGGYVGDADITVLVLFSSGAGSVIDARIGVFFTEIVGGCGCPIEPFDEMVYCEVAVRIDKFNGAVEFCVIS